MAQGRWCISKPAITFSLSFFVRFFDTLGNLERWRWNQAHPDGSYDARVFVRNCRHVLSASRRSALSISQRRNEIDCCDKGANTGNHLFRLFVANVARLGRHAAPSSGESAWIHHPPPRCSSALAAYTRLDGRAEELISQQHFASHTSEWGEPCVPDPQPPPPPPSPTNPTPSLSAFAITLNGWSNDTQRLQAHHGRNSHGAASHVDDVTVTIIMINNNKVGDAAMP